MRFTPKPVLTGIVLLMLALTKGFSQDKTISGKVQTRNGTGIPGATVIALISKKTVVTDNQGSFKIGLTGADNSLVISSIGYLQHSFLLSSTPDLNFILEEDPKALSEIVVTAYGIKKEAKRLGYSVQEIKGADLTKARDAN